MKNRYFLCIIIFTFSFNFCAASAFAQISQTKLKASDASSSASFGNAVSVDGNVMIVGSRNDDSNGTNAGSAYIFRHNGTAWIEEQKLTDPAPTAGDKFGTAVSISGSVALVGAPIDDDAGVRRGSVFVYRYNGTSWVLEQKLNASATSVRVRGFGTTLSLDGNVAIIGKTRNTDGSGEAFIFRYNGVTWVEEIRLTENSGFGRDVSISGNKVIIGAAYPEGGTGHNNNGAYIFRYDDPNWVLEQKLTHSSLNFGKAVSIDGNVAAVGGVNPFGPTEDVYVFRFNGTTWNQDAFLQNTGSFGTLERGISISGDRVMVGARAYDIPATGGTNAGSAWVYQYNGTSWSLEAQLTASDFGSGDALGFAVAIDGNTAVAGATSDDDIAGGAGAAYVFGLASPNSPPVANAGPDQNNVECTNPIATPVTLNGSASSDPDGDTLTYTWREGSTVVADPTTNPTANITLSTGAHTIELTVDDGNGDTDTDTVEITVADNTAPVITLLGNAEETVDLGTPYSDAGATALDDCDGDLTSNIIVTGSVDINVVGTYTLTYDVSDGGGNAALQVTRTVHVVDTIPPELNLVATPQSLWPPNHKYYNIVLTITGNVASVSATAVSDQADDAKGKGDGKTTGDIRVTKPDGAVILSSNSDPVVAFDPVNDILNLRAERAGKGKEGRTYTITVIGLDASGNTIGSVTTEVIVGHGAAKPVQIGAGLALGVSGNLSSEILSGPVVQTALTVPEQLAFELHPNHPNPFNPSTTIRYTLSEVSDVQLVIYNIQGQIVRTLFAGSQGAGTFEVIWDGKNM
ncbi:MAG: DUF5011 domain-containing protein, partial [Candidatus Latescibacteria bacterium]|nr:DUF5011 domain-containing protein [Candidatus Latescibacterota bacterium]